MSSIRSILVLAALVLLATPLSASAQPGEFYTYFDAHPIPGSVDGEVAWCLIEGRHGHAYDLNPEQEPVYIMDGVIYYLGDSMVRGAPIEAVWYWGAHPVAHLGGAWCVLDGPHAHYWSPWWRTDSWSSSQWNRRDGYWTWTAGYNDWYHWSYARWYDRQRAIQQRWVADPRYAYRYREVRHPAVIYYNTSRARPSWDSRQSADRYRSGRTVYVDPRRDSRYGRTTRSTTPTRSSGSSSRSGSRR